MDLGALHTIKSLNSIVISQYTDYMSIFPVHPVFLPAEPKGLCREEETEQLSNMPRVTQQEGNETKLKASSSKPPVPGA